MVAYTESVESSLAQVLAALALRADGANTFIGEQLAAPANHVLGGHIAAQALLAAGRWAGGRLPHSMHSYFLRPGDARYPVAFEVHALQQGRTFSAVRVSARQGETLVLESLVSLSAAVDPISHAPAQPTVPDPQALAPAAAYPTVWSSLRWFQRRNTDDNSTPGRSRFWWRPDGPSPTDALLNRTLAVYLSAVTLVEPAISARPGGGNNVLRDHAIWFHHTPQLTDWVLFDQLAPVSANGLTLAHGSMFDRDGRNVCTVAQELYFLP